MATAVDFFSGMGMMTYGHLMEGINVVAGLEIDGRRCGVYEDNLKVRAFRADLSSLTAAELRGMTEGAKRPLVAVGCPPCQSFSSLHRTRGAAAAFDPRTELVSRFGTLAVSLKPEAIVFENVGGILNRQNLPYFGRYLKALEASGYLTASGVLDAADFGVPQHRRRVIAVSVRRGLGAEPSLPEPTHSRDGGAGRRKWVTVRDAIGDLKPLNSGERDPGDPLHYARLHTENTLKIIRAIPKDGGSRRDLPDELVLPCHRRLGRRGAESVYGRMKWDEPSPTITSRAISPSSGRFIHPEQDRGITLREMARLQTIPDDFKTAGPTEAVAGMIGDAVPPELARAIARHVKRILKEAGY